MRIIRCCSGFIVGICALMVFSMSSCESLPGSDIGEGEDKLLAASSKGGRPIWIDNETATDGTSLYFVGVADKSASESDARSTADQNARDQLLKYYGQQLQIAERKVLESYGLSSEVQDPAEYFKSDTQAMSKGFVSLLKPELYYIEKYRSGVDGAVYYLCWVRCIIKKSDAEIAQKRVADELSSEIESQNAKLKEAASKENAEDAAKAIYDSMLAQNPWLKKARRPVSYTDWAADETISLVASKQLGGGVLASIERYLEHRWIHDAILDIERDNSYVMIIYPGIRYRTEIDDILSKLGCEFSWNQNTIRISAMSAPDAGESGRDARQILICGNNTIHGSQYDAVTSDVASLITENTKATVPVEIEDNFAIEKIDLKAVLQIKKNNPVPRYVLYVDLSKSEVDEQKLNSGNWYYCAPVVSLSLFDLDTERKVYASGQLTEATQRGLSEEDAVKSAIDALLNGPAFKQSFTKLVDAIP